MRKLALRDKDPLVSCRDLVGRRREIVLSGVGRLIVMIAPTGETAVLELVEVGRLRAALRDVVSELDGLK